MSEYRINDVAAKQYMQGQHLPFVEWALGARLSVSIEPPVMLGNTVYDEAPGLVRVWVSDHEKTLEIKHSDWLLVDADEATWDVLDDTRFHQDYEDHEEEEDTREVSPGELMDRELDHADYAQRTMFHCVLCASGEHHPSVHERETEDEKSGEAQELSQRLGPSGVGCYPPVGEAIHDEAAQVPDRVFMDDHTASVSDEGFFGNVYESVLAEHRKGWAEELLARVTRATETLEALHGHGPAEVDWETDFHHYVSRGRVHMPYKEGCSICEIAHRAEKLREESDG